MISTTERHNMETNIHCLQRVLRNSRPWFHREYYRYPLHDAVLKALHHARPADWHQLVLEHPHQSVTDRLKIAYTRDDNAGNTDRQVTTTIGKYLARHFPTLKDNIIRDISASFTATGIKIVHTTAEMIHHLLRGPTSCMTKNFRDNHPYEVYDPKYGWAMAVREENGEAVGRALLMIRENRKYFVRSYLKPKDGGYSHSDNTLEAWLLDNGFEKHHDWQGEKIKAIEHDNGVYVAPYLDGECKGAELNGDHFVICDSGEYRMDETNGYVHGRDMCECNDCSEEFEDGDGYWAGEHEDRHICPDCRDNYYTYAYSRRGNEYLIHDDYVIDVNGTPYDLNYLGDNSIVELANGDYAHLDDVVEINGEWFETDDEDICYAEDTEQYELEENCWKCEHSGNWYTNDTEYVEICGEKFHPDNAPEQTEPNKE